MPYYYQYFAGRVQKCDSGGKRGKVATATVMAVGSLGDFPVVAMSDIVLRPHPPVDLSGRFREQHRWACEVVDAPLMKYGRLGFVELLKSGEAEITSDEFSKRLATLNGKLFGYLHRRELFSLPNVRSVLPSGRTVLFPGTRLSNGMDFFSPACSRGFLGIERNWVVVPNTHASNYLIAAAC